jgi:hypothetical protein
MTSLSPADHQEFGRLHQLIYTEFHKREKEEQQRHQKELGEIRKWMRTEVAALREKWEKDYGSAPTPQVRR